jgi:excisionase family DNA binding protein
MMLTVKVAATTTGYSRSLIYALCHDGQLRHTRVGRKGKRGGIRIRSEDLERLLEECERGRAIPSPIVMKHITLN